MFGRKSVWDKSINHSFRTFHPHPQGCGDPHYHHVVLSCKEDQVRNPGYDRNSELKESGVQVLNIVTNCKEEAD